jgi:HNH endonuclease
MSEFPAAPSVAPGASAREEFIEHKKYPPVGRCIYCGSDGGTAGLSSEHIVPFSLGGNVEILKASCADCAKITSRLERHLAREIFWELRIHTNTQTRRPYERPDILPARVSIGNRHETLMLPIADHPSFLVMPVWSLPGVLKGEQPSEMFPETKAHLYYYIPPNIRDTLNLDDGQLAELHPPEIVIDPSVFARAVAKIAYCQMVAVCGLTGFRRLVLPDLILGKYPCVSYFVGCELTNPPRRMSANLYTA